MPREERDMSGILFDNDRKEPGSRQPDFKGRCMVDGVKYWVSGWTKSGAKGEFTSLAFKRMDDEEGTPF